MTTAGGRPRYVRTSCCEHDHGACGHSTARVGASQHRTGWPTRFLGTPEATIREDLQQLREADSWRAVQIPNSDTGRQSVNERSERTRAGGTAGTALYPPSCRCGKVTDGHPLLTRQEREVPVARLWRLHGNPVGVLPPSEAGSLPARCECDIGDMARIVVRNTRSGIARTE
jgi:hypothetical protein